MVRADTWQVTFLFRPRTLGPVPVPMCPDVETAQLRAPWHRAWVPLPQINPLRGLRSGRRRLHALEPTSHGLLPMGLGHTICSCLLESGWSFPLEVV